MHKLCLLAMLLLACNALLFFDPRRAHEWFGGGRATRHDADLGDGRNSRDRGLGRRERMLGPSV